VGLKPLTDMSGDDRYKGQDGGLYGGGKNDPPKEHLEAALQQAKLIQPLDAEGKPSDNGKIVMISVGMSNTTQEFSAFVRLANADPAKSPKVVIVDGAQGGMDARRGPSLGDPTNPIPAILGKCWTTGSNKLTCRMSKCRWRGSSKLGSPPAASASFPSTPRRCRGTWSPS
jgi:hypothetical protein